MNGTQTPPPNYNAPPPPAPVAAPAPVPPKRSVLKPVLIVVGVAVLLAIIAVAVWYFMRSRESQIIVDRQEQQVEEQVAASLSECQQSANPEACRQDLVERAAQEYAQVEVCDLLSGQERDACVADLARESQDAKLCALIGEAELSLACADNIYLKQATLVNDIVTCDKILDADKQDGCRRMIGQALSPSECLQAGLAADFCNRAETINQAAAAQDPALCQAIGDEETIAECLDFVYDDPDFDGLHTSLELQAGSDPRQADTDADGLNDYREVRIYKTDPNNPDTDGDSYSDGDEVQGGYNPAGEGRL